jgi:regulatory protein
MNGPVFDIKNTRGIAAIVPIVPGAHFEFPTPKKVTNHFIQRSYLLPLRRVKVCLMVIFHLQLDMAKNRPQPTARNKMMDMLSRRDHSELEVRKKLRGKFEPDEIETAIKYGKERGWLPDGEIAQRKLAEKAAQSLHRKKKGINYINHFLAERGLPQVSPDDDLELEKALALIENKNFDWSSLDREKKQKIKTKLGRFLQARGFENAIVRKVIYEKLRNT